MSGTRQRSGFALRIGAFEVTFRHRRSCQACGNRGWFHSKGSVNPHPAPEGYDGVSLCPCGAAHDRLNDSLRWMRRWERESRNKPPF